MSNLRKSLLITLEFPPQKGGTQKYYFNICNGLPDDKVGVLAPAETRLTASLQNVNFKIYRRKLLACWLYPHWLPMIWHLWRIIKKEEIELIQAGQVLPCGAAALIINKIFKIPYIVYAHGLDILGPKRGSRKQKLTKLILRGAEKVISNSKFVKNEVVKLGIKKDRVFVVYPAVTLPNRRASEFPPCQEGQEASEELSKRLVKKYNLQNKKILLTVCRLVERKGVDLVIQALNKVNERLKDLVYVVIGDGPEKRNLENDINQCRLQDSAIFTGRVSDEELTAWYELCDVFILTPKKSEFDIEGFGIVYLEANSYGKPVIGSVAGGVVEAIEDGVSGILIKSSSADGPNNVKEIVRAIVKLFDDDDLRVKLGRQGKERVEREFAIERQIEKLREFF